MRRKTERICIVIVACSLAYIVYRRRRSLPDLLGYQPVDHGQIYLTNLANQARTAAPLRRQAPMQNRPFQGPRPTHRHQGPALKSKKMKTEAKLPPTRPSKNIIKSPGLNITLGQRNDVIRNLRRKIEVTEYVTTTVTRKYECGTLTMAPIGGLGNMLFAYATVYGLAKRYNRRPYILSNLANFRPAKVFGNLTVPLQTKHPSEVVYTMKERVCCMADNRLLTIPCHDDHIHICCYGQSWQYFYEYRNELMRELTFRPDVEMQCKSALNDERKRTGVPDVNLVLVGVHIRTYQFEGGGAFAYGHPNPNISFVREAMKRFRQKGSPNKIIRFLVIGQNRKQLEETFNNKTIFPDNDYHLAQSRSWQLDFCLLTKTDHLIITAGTYAWWAAFLNKGTIMRQPDHCVKDSGLCKEYDEDGAEHYLNDRWLTIR